MRKLARSKFWHDPQGGVAVMAALLMPMLLGFAALSVDLANARLVHSRLQLAADASALAAVQKLPDTAAATTAALDLASRNVPSGYGTVMRSTDLVWGTYDPDAQVFTATNVSPNAVQLSAGRLSSTSNALPTVFGRILGTTSLDIRTAASAYRSTGPTFCVYVLDTGNSNNAFSAGGGGTFSAPNCGVQVNSSHNVSAASSSGSSSVAAKSFCIVGGYNGSFSPTPATGCASQPDPLASLAEPTAPNGGFCYYGTVPQPNQTNCGSFTISSDLTLSSGTYYFKGASLTITGGANVTGTGVMFFFDSTSTYTFASSGSVSIKAPQSGTYKGIAIFQSRSATPSNGNISITGSADFLLDGTIYVPKAKLILKGSSTISTTSKSGYLIAYQIAFSGSTEFSIGAWGGKEATGVPQKAALIN